MTTKTPTREAQNATTQAVATRHAALCEFYLTAYAATKTMADDALDRAALNDIFLGLIAEPERSRGPLISMLDLTTEGNVSTYAPFGGPHTHYVSPLMLAYIESRVIGLVQAAPDDPMVNDFYALLKYAQWVTNELHRVAPTHLPTE
jgi:hypothetical protein